jgi:hypothetical protein
LKTSIHILLIALFLTQAFSTTLILVNFTLNRKEIAKTLCVKKDEPKNCCQGSCHLKKQLQAEEKKEQSPSSTIKSIKEVQLFCQKNTTIHFNPHVLSEKAFTPFQITETTSFPLSVFHPPCLS